MPSRTHSILIAGVGVGLVGLVISFLSAPLAAQQPFGVLVCCITCLLYAAPGVVATWHYTTTHRLTIPGGIGAGMGALAALLATLISSLSSFVLLLTGRVAQQQEELMRRLEESGQNAEMMRPYLEFMVSPLGALTTVLMSLAIAAVLGAVGGAIGASVFKRGDDTPERSADAF